MLRYSNFAGVLGWPLEHTSSPAIHNAAFRRLGLDWTYLAWPVPPDELDSAVAGLKALGARGANVTMPHKQSAAELMDELDDQAQTLQAINTIEIAGGRLIGHNTDVEGFVGLLDDIGAEVAGRQALVLGTGGAARSVIKALTDLDIGAIQVAARDPKRADGLQSISAAVEIIAWDTGTAAASSCDLIVNCTPVGSDGLEAPIDARFHPAQTVVDLIYQVRTPLLERAKQGGAEAWGGLGMLVHQAAASFRIWTGLQPPVEVMSAAALHGLRSAVAPIEE